MITNNKVIKITILAEDHDGNRFYQEIIGEDAENWMSEVEFRLGSYYQHTKIPFPEFKWDTTMTKEPKGIDSYIKPEDEDLPF